MPSSEWAVLRVAMRPEIAEAVGSFLLDQGAVGLLEDETAVEATVPRAEQGRIVDALSRYLASLASFEPGAALATVETLEVPPVDWAALARAHHRPLAIGERLLVAPPWDVPVGAGRLVLVLEPGMAFGTGQHATTRTCLEEIETQVAGGGVGSALDVGTGSGILALALARLGVRRVVALDCDRAVLPIARATLDGNGARSVRLLAGTASAVRGRFDLVVANLLAGTIVAEQGALAATVLPGGRLVLSGVLGSQADDVVAAFAGWRVVGRRDAEEWSTITLARAAGGSPS